MYHLVGIAVSNTAEKISQSYVRECIFSEIVISYLQSRVLRCRGGSVQRMPVNMGPYMHDGGCRTHWSTICVNNQYGCCFCQLSYLWV